MRRTRRSPPARDDGRRLDGVETARDSGRRAGRGGVTAPALALREQIGQLASRRLWRQEVGTPPPVLGGLRAGAGGGSPPPVPPQPAGPPAPGPAPRLPLA